MFRTYYSICLFFCEHPYWISNTEHGTRNRWRRRHFIFRI